ncbi:hypothetical protein PWG71_11640 [Nocardiopsis sp. N85]|uniref:hypothetical protein n=1 Tax=Nocardiopsis sp. N85 TaxID=3029400 RepID=UPI00237FB71A|nr:hypothetical protein [Nocardiopsis sp. N85]MDE3722043.1 hypothetical protein [Nocardiopsis sp. N85]
MSTCSTCGRHKTDSQCGYCLGRAMGAEIQRRKYEAERDHYATGAGASPRRGGGGCALLLLAAAASPLAAEAARILL